ncbi:MAG TPA: DUF2281 domain-containing protein [Anaerolineae bacterium]|nr:DUF2281 domain-containing protein [Anaerolineae bacterium]
MPSSRILKDIDSLPPEAQRQVIDFIAFLKTRYQTTRRASKSQRKLADEPFVGMWQDRDDLQDSSAWLRDLRRREWERTA